MVLVTGAAGHSGYWFMKRWTAERPNEKIRCLVRPSTDLSWLKALPGQIEFVVGDFYHVEEVERHIDGVTTLIHFGGIHISERLVKLALKRKIGWVILVHTTGRYSQFKSASAEYIATEEFVFKSGINYTILRPTMIYGSSRDRNIWKLVDYLYRRTFFPVFGQGQNLMQPIHAKDVGEAVYLAYANREKTFNKCYDIAGKDPITYLELLKTVSAGLKRRNIMVRIPYQISYWATAIYNFFVKDPKITVEQVMRLQEDKAFDYSQAAKDFSFAPRSFKDGIAGEIEEYLSLQRLK